MSTPCGTYRTSTLIRRAFRDTPYAAEVENLVARIADHLPDVVRGELDREPPLAIILASADDLSPHHASFQTVERAIRKRQMLEFEYRSPQTQQVKKMKGLFAAARRKRGG